MTTIFYDDIDQRACATLREMIGASLIADGDVDGRDVATLQPRELDRYDRVHLFAGIGGFEIAARLAGWPDGVQLWTGGFPCQPFSVAGRREGAGDDRYLWPEFERLIRGCRPEFVLIENVAAIDSAPDMVLDRVLSDLETLGYETWAAEIPACAVDAAHKRNRVWVTAHRDQSGPQERGSIASDARPERTAVERGGAGAVGYDNSERIVQPGRLVTKQRRWSGDAGIWGSTGWITCHDSDGFGRQRFRRIPLGLLDPSRILVDGLPSRTLALHGLGNSIVPQVAAEILRAAL